MKKLRRDARRAKVHGLRHSTSGRRYAACGTRGPLLPLLTDAQFEWLPRESQCARCRALKPNGWRFASEEMITIVEVICIELHRCAKVELSNPTPRRIILTDEQWQQKINELDELRWRPGPDLGPRCGGAID